MPQPFLLKYLAREESFTSSSEADLKPLTVLSAKYQLIELSEAEGF
jgi:hypothetical protein